MDKIKFEELYLSCRTAVERFVYYKMASKSDADDILQEVAIAAFKNISEVKKPESFKSWILKIAANKCNDFYRSLAKRHEIALDDMIDTVVSMSRYGVTEIEIVRDTLADMADKDKQILFLYYFKNKSQAEIAQLLKIPLGTVKSRLHKAKQNFKEAYPFPPESSKKLNCRDELCSFARGENNMKKLPDILPEYKITKSAKAPFDVRCEESPGWFIIPRLGEKITWAIYEVTDKTRVYEPADGERLEITSMEVTGKASIHGIEGVEISSVEDNPVEANQVDGNKMVRRKFIAQLTDTHCRFLAESYTNKDGVNVYRTFLDGDNFNMGVGEDNCGHEVERRQKGIIQRNGGEIVCPEDKQVMDITGRYDVEINGKIYDTVCFTDIEFYDTNVFSEQYIDANGRTILWRRFNKNDWNYKRYNEHYNFDGTKLWSEMFPDNEQVTVNGEIYVHWYDCITDYIL